MEELDNDFTYAVCGATYYRRLNLTPSFDLQFRVNTLGPVHSITAFLPLLRASDKKTVVVIGSAAGNLTSIRALGIANVAAYGISKAAALIVTTKFALKLKDEGFVVVALEPGVVDTTGTAAPHGMFAIVESQQLGELPY